MGIAGSRNGADPQAGADLFLMPTGAPGGGWLVACQPWWEWFAGHRRNRCGSQRGQLRFGQRWMGWWSAA